MAEQKSVERQTVKALSWQLLYSNYANQLGAEGWQKLAAQVAAPDFRHMDPDEDTPMGPFNQAVLYVDRVVGCGDGAKIREITRASVVSWARIYRNLVNQLQGRPWKMMEIFCTEVHPYFLDDFGASQLIKSSPSEAIVRLDNGLLEDFKVGLLEGFVEITGADAAVERRADGAYRITWKIHKDAPQPSKFALLINATRAPFLTAAAVPVLLGTAIAWRDGALSFGFFLITFAAALCFQAGANVINDYFDHTSGADEANLSPGPFFGGSRVIQRGLLQPVQVRNLGLTLYAIGALLGLSLASLTGHPLEIVGLGIVGIAIGIIYTAPRLSLAARGLGEFALAIAFGPLIVVGTYFVQTGQWSLGALYASLPVALLIAAVLYINEIPDRPWDMRAGKRTLVVRLPMWAVLMGYSVLIAATYALILAGALLNVMPLLTLIALATLPLAWKAIQVLQKNYRFPYRLIPANANTIFVHLLTGLLLFYAYIAAGLFHA
jgi:1,4-dihydroxy-2-naphthoate polyprenyltransferase